MSLITVVSLSGYQLSLSEIKKPIPVRALPNFVELIERISLDSEFSIKQTLPKASSPVTDFPALCDRLVQHIPTPPKPKSIPKELLCIGVTDQFLAELQEPVRSLILSRSGDVARLINATQANISLLRSFSVEMLEQFLNQTNNVTLLIANDLISMPALMGLPEVERMKLFDCTPELRGLLGAHGFGTFQSFAGLSEELKIFMLRVICR